MKMTTVKLRDILDERLGHETIRTSFNRDKDTYRVEWKHSGQGITITLPNVVSKYNDKGKSAIDELVDHVQEALKIMDKEHELAGKDKQVYPVIRSTSFPVTLTSGEKLVYKSHTAETRVFYALDLGKSYQLIDESMLKEVDWTLLHLDEVATFNIRSLTNNPKLDRVGDNYFYFIATQDGYDASRILNDAFLEEMKKSIIGDMAVAVPHQDVLIIADIQNGTGYDILAQMTMKFFTEGRIPITSLSFVYENGSLEPIFILAKNKPKK